MFLARSFPVSPQLVVKANSCSSDNNRMPENPSAACPMRNRLSLYVDYCRAFCALARNSALVMAYTLVKMFTGSAYISCKVIPSFSATRREGKFVLF